jgi:DNA-binding NarL/FixJ family response regulator
MELRVFLVEDLQTMTALMADLFSSIGGIRIVGTAETEAEAKLWLDDHVGEWDIAVVDLVLAQGSGFGVISHAHGSHARGKIAVFSSYTSAGIQAHCLSLGATVVFDKRHTAQFTQWVHDQAAPK